jgi:AcrR family transcriptional regulator
MPLQPSDNPDSPPKRRRAPKGEMRRAALLDAATEVFARDGYAGASMKDIADIAGITTVGLLHHFPNKVALLRAMIDRRSARMTERFGALRADASLEGFLRFLRFNMQLSIESLPDCQAAVMINTESLSTSHPAWPWYKEKFETTHMHAQAHLRALIAGGEIRQGVDPAVLAVEIFSVMDGLQMQWLRSPGSVQVLPVFDSYLARLAKDLRSDLPAPS